MPGRASLARILLHTVALSGLALAPRAASAGVVDNQGTPVPGSATLPVRGPIPARAGSYAPGRVLAGEPGVAFAEPDWIRRVDACDPAVCWHLQPRPGADVVAAHSGGHRGAGRTVVVVAGFDQDRGCPGDNLPGVAFNSGTSFAAPFVTGLLALAASPSPLVARLALESTADDHPGGDDDAKPWAHGAPRWSGWCVAASGRPAASGSAGAGGPRRARSCGAAIRM